VYTVALVRKRAILTERSPLVGEVSANFSGYRVSRSQRNGSRRPLISVVYTRSRYFSIQLAPQLSSRGWVDAVPDPLFHRKYVSACSRTRGLWICSQELLDHRGGRVEAVCHNILQCPWISLETMEKVTINIRKDSNLEPLKPKSVAFPLSYTSPFDSKVSRFYSHHKCHSVMKISSFWHRNRLFLIA
jgi:hypothetical protein